MKRSFETVYPENQSNGYIPGDEAAHRAALALADRADAPTIAAFVDALTLMERVGGQFHIVSLRQQVSDDDYETIGLAFRYETRDARLKLAASPEEVIGIPVSDSQLPPPLPEQNPEPGETPEPENLRDEIEAEVAAAEASG